METPTRIGAYEVVRPAGAGGMGYVFQARDPELGRQVAIKFPRDEPGERGALLRARFAREARSLSAIRHPNLVTLYEVGEHEGLPYAVLEWIEGATLEASVTVGGPLGELEAARLVAQLAMATHNLHLHGFLHRDIKPENVLMRGKEPVLADLGLVKSLEPQASEPTLTVAGRALGTPGYAAPELIRGDLEATGPQSDVYGLGATLYFLLTGRSPRGEAPSVAQLLALNVPPPTRYREGLDPALSDLCRRALACDPGRRFRSAQSFADALIRWALVQEQGQAIYGRTFASLWEEGAPYAGLESRPPDQLSGRRALWAGLALGVLGVVCLGVSIGLVGVSSSTTPSPTPEAEASDLAVELARAKLRLELAGVEAIRLRQELAQLRRVPSFPLTKAGGDSPADWYYGLSADARPSLPLPPGIECDATAGRYRALQDDSLLVWVPAGSFQMGGSELSDAPAHRVKLRQGFFLGLHEVTWRQWDQFNEATGRPLASRPQVGGRQAFDEDPVVGISFFEAQAYCAWSGLRLPSESEWEYAARGPNSSRWPVGEAGLLCNARGERDGYAGPAPVGSFRFAPSPFGTFDLAGNVSEWVRDVYVAGYPAGPVNEEPIVSGRELRQVARGGNWSSPLEWCDPARRESRAPNERSETLGFRVARSAVR